METKEKMLKTSIKLPESVLRGLRQRAIDDKNTSRYGYLIEQYIRDGLKRDGIELPAPPEPASR